MSTKTKSRQAVTRMADYLPVAVRPKCRFCKKHLRPWVDQMDMPTSERPTAEEAMAFVADTLANEHSKLFPKCIVSIEPSIYSGRWRIGSWCGGWHNYGLDADGTPLFCGVNCAAAFGRLAARAGYVIE